MRFADSSLSFELKGGEFAIKCGAGEAEELHVHLQDESLRVVINEIVEDMQADKLEKRRIKVEEREADAHLSLSVERKAEATVEGSTRIVFNVVDDNCRAHGLTRMPYNTPVDTRRLLPVMRSAADFFWHLKRTKPIKDYVALECFELHEDATADEFVPVMKPRDTDNNLNKGGIIEIPVGRQATYGFLIKNMSPVALYAALFYFDASDFSIRKHTSIVLFITCLMNDSEQYYVPGNAKNGDIPACLPAGGCLTIGYGAGGALPWSYELRKGQDVDVGFLKLFVSTKSVDYSHVEQQSPFPQFRLGRQLQKPVRPAWGSITVAMVQK